MIKVNAPTRAIYCVGLAAALTCAPAAFCAGAVRPADLHRKKVSPTDSLSAGKLPHGSFVVQQFHDSAELIRQLERNPGVAQRYARLTNMTPQMVRMALRTLHLKHLAAETSLEVYYCHITPRGEVLGFRKRRVPKGTAVFAFADGTPALLQACGNPTRALVLATPAPPKPAVPISLVPAVLVSRLPAGLPEVTNGAFEFYGFDDFEEAPASELYVPQQPSLPAARLASYSADNLHEWVRHASHATNFGAAGLSLGGAALLGVALSSGGNGGFPLPSTPVVIGPGGPSGGSATGGGPTGGSAGTIDIGGGSPSGGPTGGSTGTIPGGGDLLGGPGANGGTGTLPGSGGASETAAAVPEPSVPMVALAIGASFTGTFLRRRNKNRTNRR